MKENSTDNLRINHGCGYMRKKPEDAGGGRFYFAGRMEYNLVPVALKKAKESAMIFPVENTVKAYERLFEKSLRKHEVVLT